MDRQNTENGRNQRELFYGSYHVQERERLCVCVCVCVRERERERGRERERERNFEQVTSHADVAMVTSGRSWASCAGSEQKRSVCEQKIIMIAVNHRK